MIIKDGVRNFLTCEEFKGYDKEAVCCQQCHHPDVPKRTDIDVSSKLLFFAPRSADGLNRDYSLGIEGVICCTMYHVLLNISREEWVKIADRVTRGVPVYNLTSPAKRDIIGGKSKPAVKAPGKRAKSTTCVVCGEPSDTDVCSLCG